jgi:DNA-binding transcriptional LysR family regulator
MDLPPTEGFAAVLAAAERGSVSAAAVELGVTHGAVSRRIQAVEHWLGVPIFERHGRGVRLTPLGALFVKRVERSLRAITLMGEDVRAAQRTNSVRLTVLPSVARLWVLPSLAGLQGDPVDTEIHVQTDHRVLSLENGETDIAIRAGTGAWAGVRATLLFGDHLSLVSAPALAERLSNAEVSAVMTETLLYDSDAGDWRSWCQETGVRFRPLAGVRRFEDHDLVLAAAEAGVGVALVREPLATGYLARTNLVRIGSVAAVSGRGHYVVTRHNEGRPAVLRVEQRIIASSRFC